MDIDFIPFSKVGFVGLGLIGGSIAKHIRRIFPDTCIIGYDIDTPALNTALADGTLTECARNVGSDFAKCDLIFLCAPTHYNIDCLQKLKPVLDPECILTDVGSVKQDICDAVATVGMDDCFIGGHPMVGSEQCGYQAANDHLIENAYYFVTPSQAVSGEKTERFTHYMKALGALPIVYSPEEHDHITSYISHIPHVIAASLVNLVKDADTDGMYKELAAGGFKDITRIASSSPTVWEHILLSNGDQVAAGLTQYIALLEKVQQMIIQKDGQAIHDFFASAMAYRNAVPNKATGAISTHFECFIDIHDEPGALNNVTKLLSANGINIKNISIANNREECEGALLLEFYSATSLEQATLLLRQHGYNVFEK